MEIQIRRGRRCQLYLLREGFLREGHPFYLFLPHETSEMSSDFQKHLGACTYELKLGLPTSYKAVALAAHPRHKAQLILETW